ncbi:MAG: 4Fe-4S dicluster domain-containing protein [Candidatus Cloacimonadota bacterium]|nr:4Fe-4S dicluster domain-containing protein [Candidatus Cloacimonadota bacterium]
MVKVKKTNLKSFIEFIKKDFDMFAPTKNGKKTVFRKIDDVNAINLNISNTHLSPKNVFFPQAEVLFEYSKDGVKVPKKLDKPIAVWGMRNCDVNSLKMLDKVFAEAHQMPRNQMYKDPYWNEKYKNSIIFNQACNEPLSTCFCNWFDGNPFKKDGDVFVVDDGDNFILEGISKKGKDFLSKYNKFEKVNKSDEDKIAELKTKAESYLTEKVDVTELFDKMKEIDDANFWTEVSAKCINCGACTFVCGTCHCFDISDEGKDKEGKRIRLWDSCMFQIFTKEASGHNPRGQSAQRVRQRIMHKYNFFMDNYNQHLCTGCGRCVVVCPVNLDIREIIQRVLKYKSVEDK